MIVLDLLDLANFWEDLAVRRTAIAATIAFVVGWFLLRRLLNLPGVSGAVHGVPIMLIAFISAAILLLIARAPSIRCAKKATPPPCKRCKPTSRTR